MQRKTVDTNAPSDVVVNFDTSLVTERVWYGTASGGVSGNVTIETLNNPPQVLRGTWAGATRQNYFYVRSLAGGQTSRAEWGIGTDYPSANYRVH
jgi:hypothetical protein